MTQLNIDIIVHEEGKEPTINAFKPDPMFPWQEDDNMKPTITNIDVREKMTILNWKNTHFNLVVGPEHMLSQVGSINFQSAFNEGIKQSSGPSTRTGTNAGGKGAGEETQVHQGRNTRTHTSAGGRGAGEERHVGPGVSGGLPTDLSDNQKTGDLQSKDDLLSKYKDLLKDKDRELKKLINTIDEMRSKFEILTDKYDTDDIEELDSEAAFVRKEGYARKSPMEPSEPTFKCPNCANVSKSKNLREEHLLTHEKHTNKFHCDVCNKVFDIKSEFVKHKKNTHTVRSQLNCNDCQFQATSGPELRKHMNAKSHQAAKGVDLSNLGETSVRHVLMNSVIGGI